MEPSQVKRIIGVGRNTAQATRRTNDWVIVYAGTDRFTYMYGSPAEIIAYLMIMEGCTTFVLQKDEHD